MWIVPRVVLVDTSASAQEAAGLTSLSRLPADSLASTLSRSFAWRGKPMPLQSWSRAWKREPWVRALCGRTFCPSTPGRFEAWWIGCLVASPASRGASPGSARERVTSAICGQVLAASSGNARLTASSLKTWQGICPAAAVKSQQTFKAWVTGLRLASSRRRASEPVTSAPGSSSSGGAGPGSAQAQSWKTPAVVDSRGHEYTRDKGKKGAERLSLPGQATAWPTATTADADQTRQYARGNPSLGLMASSWPTVTTSDGENGPGNHGREGGLNLRTAAAAWPTPRASPNENRNTKPTPSHGLTHGQTLAGVAMEWPTPAPAPASTPSPSPPDPTTPLGGSTTSSPSRVLNPLFVEALMGWPIGWSDFGSWGTAWSLLRELSQS